MSNQLAIRNKQTASAVNIPQGQEWSAMVQQAEVLVKSGFLPDSIKTPEQALAIMLKGRELGVPSMVAIGHIHVIKGQPSCAVQLQLALCYERIPGFKCEVYSTKTDATCIAIRPGSKPYTSRFTLDDAKKAGLLNNPNWTKYTQIMLEWRAIGHALKIVCPDAIMGLDVPDMYEPVAYETDEGMNIKPEAPEGIQEWQVKKIHMEKARCFGDDDEAYRRFLETCTEKTSCKDMTFAEAGRVLTIFTQIPDKAESITNTDEQPVDCEIVKSPEDEMMRKTMIDACKERSKDYKLSANKVIELISSINSEPGKKIVDLTYPELNRLYEAMEECVKKEAENAA